jgi:uncharacterized protein (TIGR02001 family)
MRIMKRMIGLAVLASAATIAGTSSASAEGAITANVALTSDYVFRGVSLSGNDPAIQGGADYESDFWYAGIWASSLSEGTEIDLYAGITPTTGPIEWDFGLITYFYPGADDDDAEFDYAEIKGTLTWSATEQLEIGGGVWYTPENYGDTGDATYLEVNAAYALNDQLSFSGAFGNQTVEDPDGPFGLAGEDDYNTWNLGGTFALHGFEVDLRYHDTDIDEGSDIENYTYGPSSYDEAFVVTVGREL